MLWDGEFCKSVIAYKHPFCIIFQVLVQLCLSFRNQFDIYLEKKCIDFSLDDNSFVTETVNHGNKALYYI